MRVTQSSRNKRPSETEQQPTPPLNIAKTFSEVQMVESKPPGMEPHRLQPANTNFLEVEDVTKILAESFRNSFLVRDLDQTQLDMVAESLEQEGMDSNSIRLKNSPLSNTRELIHKKGTLEIEEQDVGCCMIGLGRESTKKMCCLERNVLTIETRKEYPLHLCFDAVHMDIRKLNDKEFRIIVPDRPQTTFSFKAATAAEAEEWYKAILWTVENSYGAKYKLNSILENPRFERLEFIIEEEFFRNCNSGDILLFKDNHTMAKIQRAITFSEYGISGIYLDHVALVLKNRRDEVILFESNSNSGVAFLPWKQLLRYRWYKTISRIAWRRLSLQRSRSDLQIMEDFIVKNLNKKFDLNVDKMFKRVSKIHKTEQEERERTYFCSELVAAFYKKLGLLEQEKATTQYWPVTFSDARELQLLRGHLEHERIIVFEDQLIRDRL